MIVIDYVWHGRKGRVVVHVHSTTVDIIDYKDAGDDDCSDSVEIPIEVWPKIVEAVQSKMIKKVN